MKTNLSGILTLLLAFVVHISFAQEKTISGMVSDQSGLPLPGVNIVVVGTTNGTQTDFDGNYTIKASEGQTLLFTYIGQKEMRKKVGAGNSINVQMEDDAQALDEVVVTAVGITRSQKGLGYNVQSVEAEAISVKPNADLVNSLSGATSGVQIVSASGEAGASTFITIRGSSSITGNNQPLFIVNGQPIDTGGGDSGTGGVNTSNRTIDINPDDIASLSVLKGGAATALYGVRAANGAIIITTKSGKNLTERRIEFHTSIGVDVVSHLPARQKKYAQGQAGVWISGNADSWGPEISSLEYDGDTSYRWDPKGSLVPKGTGNGTPAQYYDPYDFFQNGYQLNNRFSISNGTEQGDYYFSMSNLEQEGIIPNNTYGRTTLRLNGSTKISDKITFGANMAYTNSRAVQIQKGSNVSGIMLGLLRTAASFDNSAGYEFADGTQRNYRNGGGYDNPYWTANNIAYEEDVNRFTGNINLNVQFTDELSLVYNTGIDWYNTKYTDTFKIGSRAQTSGYYKEFMDFNSVFNSDLLLTYRKDISDKFNMSATIGNNFFSDYYKYLRGDATGLEIPDFYQLNNSSSNTTSTFTANYRTSAVFADLQFSYDDMIFLGFTGRNDWSTTMPQQNKSAFYPSASLGFVFSEIGDLKSDFFSFGKLRASAARTANIAPAYSTSNYYEAANGGDGWTGDDEGISYRFPYQDKTSFFIDDDLGNADLKHETQDTWEVGADLRFFKSRLGLDFTYFKNTNTDLLMPVPIAATSGFNTVYLNAASMESKGIEISVNATPIKTENFTWDFVANYTQFKNPVTALADGVDNVFLGGFTVPQVRAVVGEEYRSIFGEDWYRDSNGNVLINDDPTDSYRDGYPMNNTAQGLVPIGNFNPDWTANITNSISYKNLSLSFLIDIKKGGVMYNGTAFAMNKFGVSKRTEKREVYYNTDGSINFDTTPEENLVVMDGVYGHIDANGDVVSSGVTNVTPVVQDQEWFQGQGSNFGGGPSIAAMEPADWVRLRDLTFAYNLPEIGDVIKGGQIYFSGRNLWIDTPYSGIDPETNLGGATNAQGMDYFNSPGTRSYTLGLKLTF
ncbi:SusC/RagA family TonB-linked outer membrane protein [Maribacter polysiphoniae]|uniref:SusC/RagA family TonB-linked outer membrane protein n=1 Tax=Maribacter polysiphoniae TaxID=429344 RepID=A0A316E2Z1_9FLAO|nr:SusC/RagA family TonB-linked outer membrane protein [Maribacter polysiphoniae]MBD1259493.1 SusC/RagA family TonB-linked outer membrane protein [Maribacter polysiphoniae]PWK25057.1 TonB-linked SusC/RagA family outer membrane protein [Maribacter polysiphoniae]